MKVKILKELFNDLDDDSEIILVVQRGPEYQEMLDFSILNDVHPCGKLVMHTIKLEDDCGVGSK